MKNNQENPLKIRDYLVSWWSYSGRQDDYVDYDLLITATSPENAIELIRKQGDINRKIRRGKNFKAVEVKVTDYKKKIFEFL